MHQCSGGTYDVLTCVREDEKERDLHFKLCSSFAQYKIKIL